MTWRLVMIVKGTNLKQHKTTRYSKDLMELFCARQRRKFSRGIKRA